VLGVVPYLEDLYFDDEDSLSRSVRTVNKKNNVKLTVVVPQLPRVSNQTDFEPLLLNPQVEVNFVADARLAPPCDLIVLPGSKSVRDDLKWLKSKGWAELIARHLRYGGKVIGLCGGFQMLGRAIHDPFGVESEPGSSFGLGLLDIETTLEQSKRLALVKGNLTINGAFVEGYEIHMGTTYGAGANNPFKRPLLAREDGGENQYEGLISDDDQIIGTYLHGLFDRKEAAQTILAWAGLVQDEIPDFLEIREKNIHRFAELLRGSLDLDNLAAILNIDTARLQ
jgi:adenosylcobyric acid synthase